MEIPMNVMEQIYREAEEKKNQRRQMREDRKMKAELKNDDKNEKKGILLLFLSDYKYNDFKQKTGEADEYEYYYDGSTSYKGRQTNEAPVQYLYQKAEEDGFPVKKIICVCSNKVKNEKISDNEDGITAFDIFQNRVYKRWGWDVSIQEIGYDENEEDVNLALISLYGELTAMVEDSENCKVYIDYSGGMRDINFLMVTIVRHMEFRGIQCGSIVYGQYDRSREKQKIIDISYINEMMRMINAVSEFVSTGNAKELNALSLKGGHALFEIMKEFSDDMSLCNVESIEKQIKEIDCELNKMEKVTKDDPDLFNCMIRTIIPTIREKLYLKEILGDISGVTNYPWLIKWCIDNNLIQQAMTIYVEKMPIYYKEMQYIKVDDMYQFEQFTIEGRNREWLKKWAKEMVVNNYPMKQKLTDAQKADNSKDIMKKIASWLNDIQKKQIVDAHEDGIEPEILVERIRRLFDSDGVKNDVCIYDTANDVKNVLGFLNKVNSNTEIYIHYLLKDDKESYIPRKKKSNDEQKDGSSKNISVSTYENKWQIIEEIKNNPDCIDRNIISDEIDAKELVRIMEYYLAAKIIRNNLNHAGGNQIDLSLEDVKERLKEDGIVIEMNVERIKEIVKEGIDNEL